MNKFFDKTINHIINYINEAVFYEIYAKEKGLLQSIEPRIKIISLLLLIVSSLMSKDIVSLLIFNIFAILLAHLSKIPILTYLKRIYFFIPIFAGLVAIPTLFNLVNPGADAIVLLQNPHISITYEGIRYFIIFVLRISTCISYGILIPMTTEWNIVIGALKKFKIPDEVITLLNMSYRYIFLLLTETLNMMYSKKSRTVKKLGYMESWSESAKSIGHLFIKTCSMGEEIYYGMLSRGGTTISTYYDYKITLKDILFLISIIIFIIIVWLL